MDRVRNLETSVTGHGQEVHAVHTPQTVAEVVALVRSARQRGARLYPVSTGRNWGYGSRTPVQPGCEIVDLRRMNRIRNASEIGLRNPVALIEPGVTQGQLHTLLDTEHHNRLTFNVTGSAPDTSILGNALDRGVGYYGSRSDDLFGLEAVTGTGEVIHTGFRRLGDDSPLAMAHAAGMGPAMDGLFYQGNFGIVTSACFRLRTRAPFERVVSLQLRDPARLADFVDTMAGLKRDGLWTSVAHIGNLARAHATLRAGIYRYLVDDCARPPQVARELLPGLLRQLAPHSWTGFGAVVGTEHAVRAALREIRQRLSPLAAIRVLGTANLERAASVLHRLRAWPPALRFSAAVHAIRPLHLLALGIPTDAAVRSLLWEAGEHEADSPDAAPSCGLLYVAPALPMDGAFVARALARLQEVASRHGHEQLYVTVNTETASSMVAVMNIVFDRRSARAVAQAHACADALLQEIHTLGLEVYRARADMMPELTARQPSHWAMLAQLKSVLDPDGVIAPGRYSSG